jgi:hypothetical protein
MKLGGDLDYDLSEDFEGMRFHCRPYTASARNQREHLKIPDSIGDIRSNSVVCR